MHRPRKTTNISTLFVNDDDGSFYGAIDLKDLIVAREETALDSLISRNFPTVLAHEHTEECLDRLRSYAEDSIPVLGEKRRVIGVITTDDIVEAVDDAMGDNYAKLGGLTGEEDLHEPLKTSLKKRMPWLIILLFLGMGVSSVVGLFEAVILLSGRADCLLPIPHSGYGGQRRHAVAGRHHPRADG